MINNNKDDDGSVLDIDFDMSLFSKTHVNHSKFVDDMHIFMRIIHLEIEKVKVNSAIVNDNKEIIHNNYNIQFLDFHV